MKFWSKSTKHLFWEPFTFMGLESNFVSLLKIKTSNKSLNAFLKVVQAWNGFLNGDVSAQEFQTIKDKYWSLQNYSDEIFYTSDSSSLEVEVFWLNVVSELYKEIASTDLDFDDIFVFSDELRGSIKQHIFIKLRTLVRRRHGQSFIQGDDLSQCLYSANIDITIIQKILQTSFDDSNELLDFINKSQKPYSFDDLILLPTNKMQEKMLESQVKKTAFTNNSFKLFMSEAKHQIKEFDLRDENDIFGEQDKSKVKLLVHAFELLVAIIDKHVTLTKGVAYEVLKFVISVPMAHCLSPLATNNALVKKASKVCSKKNKDTVSKGLLSPTRYGFSVHIKFDYLVLLGANKKTLINCLKNHLYMHKRVGLYGNIARLTRWINKSSNNKMSDLCLEMRDELVANTRKDGLVVFG